jgi:hypothetical protein
MKKQKKHIEFNPAYQYAGLVTLTICLNWIFGREGNVLLVECGLGFFIAIYILDKILKKL